MDRGKALLYVHLVLGVGTTEIVFGGFVETVSVVLEQVCELQELMLPVFDVSRLAGLEIGLKGGVDLQRGKRWLNIRNGRQREMNLLNFLDGCVLEVDHVCCSCLSWNRQTVVRVG